MTAAELVKLAQDALQDMKGQDLVEIEVADQTSVTDYLLVVSGTSNRHVRSLAENVVEESKKPAIALWVSKVRTAVRFSWTLVVWSCIACCPRLANSMIWKSCGSAARVTRLSHRISPRHRCIINCYAWDINRPSGCLRVSLNTSSACAQRSK